MHVHQLLMNIYRHGNPNPILSIIITIQKYKDRKKKKNHTSRSVLTILTTTMVPNQQWNKGVRRCCRRYRTEAVPAVWVLLNECKTSIACEYITRCWLDLYLYIWFICANLHFSVLPIAVVVPSVSPCSLRQSVSFFLALPQKIVGGWAQLGEIMGVLFLNTF